MLRRPDKPYKFGRSTNRGGELIKLKRYEDAEAVVIGFEPWYENQNEATESELGYQTRSAHQENKVPLDRLGTLKCRLLTDESVEFDIGVMQGVTHAERDRLWTVRESLIGAICKFKHQGYGGGYDKPRTPVFLNWRDRDEF
jgi:DNA ligase 1